MGKTAPAPPQRHRRRVALGALLALVVLGTVTVAAVPELRTAVHFAMAPESARDATVVRLQKGPVVVTLVGSIHGRHLTTPSFGLAHLKAVLLHLRPGVVLVEARPEELAAGRWGDGPIEMPFVALWARALGMAVDGIDWWLPPDDRLRRTDDERDDRIFRNLAARLPTAGVVLVVVGFSHVPEQARRLEDDGFQRIELSTRDAHALFELPAEPFAYPPGMADAIRQRITDCDAQAATAEPGFADDLRSVATARRAYLDQIDTVGEAPSAR